MFDYFKKLNNIVNLLFVLEEKLKKIEEERLAKIEKEIAALNRETGIKGKTEQINGYSGESGNLKQRIYRLEWDILDHNGQRGIRTLDRLTAVEDKLKMF